MLCNGTHVCWCLRFLLLNTVVVSLSLSIGRYTKLGTHGSKKKKRFVPEINLYADLVDGFRWCNAHPALIEGPILNCQMFLIATRLVIEQPHLLSATSRAAKGIGGSTNQKIGCTIQNQMAFYLHCPNTATRDSKLFTSPAKTTMFVHPYCLPRTC